MNNNISQISHTHRHHHADDAEVFKTQQLRAIHRRKVFSRVLFYTLVVVAVAIILFVFWIYTH
jgi:cell division protein FtsL